MKNSNQILHNVTKSAIQKLVEIEANGWPPITLCGMYQPCRPEKGQFSETSLNELSLRQSQVKKNKFL